MEETLASEEPQFIEEPTFSDAPIFVMGLWIFNEEKRTLTKQAYPGRSKGVEHIAKLRKVEGGWEVESITKRFVNFEENERLFHGTSR